MAKILIVDDSPTEQYVIAQYLQKAGHQTVTADDGESGLIVAKKEQPDLVFMDVVMPGLNGFQATRKLKRDPSTANIPVVIVTTKDQETDREWGLRQGASAYLVKPVSAEELLESVGQLLG